MNLRRSILFLKVAALALLLGASTVTVAQAADASGDVVIGGLASENERVIRNFVAAWSNLNADELVGYFAIDGTYYNMPTRPVTGHENLRKFIGGFLEGWEQTNWEILNLLARGDIVMVERMDRTIVRGKPVNLPCFGIFEMKDGKIVEWRDYFDLATFVKAVSG